MLTRKSIMVLGLSVVLCACSHPIEIVGEGDVLSATGTRNCYLEEYVAGKDSCAGNLVVEEYFETYYAMPRRGWKFASWKNYCEDSAAAQCSFKLAAATVKQYWGAVMPPLIAVFSPISKTELEQEIVESDAVVQRQAAEQEAARIAAEQAALIAAEQETARIADEQAAIDEVQKSAARKAAEQASAGVADQQAAFPKEPAKLRGSASLRWSIPRARQDGASLKPGELVRYDIYITAQSTGQKNVLSVHNPLQTNYIVSNLLPGVYHFAMVAVDKSGLYSKQSAVVSLKIGD